MNKITCMAVKKRIADSKGKPTVEWWDGKDKPRVYCCGYIDNRTDELLAVCCQCVKNVIHAQDDMEMYFGDVRRMGNDNLSAKC